MKKLLQKKLKDERGLTLIELLAVIVILAIIAAIAIPAISNIIENSRVGAAKSDAVNVLNAAQLYLVENGAAVEGTGNITQAELVDGGFLDDLGGFEGTIDDPATAADESSGGSITNVDEDANGDLILTGTAIISGVTVAFNGATLDEINAMPNGTGSAAGEADASGNITVTR